MLGESPKILLNVNRSLKGRRHGGFSVTVQYVCVDAQMMNNLLLEEGSIVQVENISLPVATFAKFQPQSPDFLDITNPKAVYPFAQFFRCPSILQTYLSISALMLLILSQQSLLVFNTLIQYLRLKPLLSYV